MKIKKYFNLPMNTPLFLLIATFHSNGTNSKKEPTNTYIKISNNLNANQTSKSDQKSNPSSNSSSRQKSNSETNEKYKPILSTFTDNVKENITSLNHWASNNKLKIALSTVAIVYFGTLYKIVNIHSAINSNECWSLWKSSLNFETFLSIPQKELTEELVSDINLKNANPKNPADFLNPLVSFINQTNKEMQNLKDFIAIANIIKNLNLERIFFINETEILKAQERVQKLTYIKNIFSTWMSDYRKQHLLNLKATG